MLIPESRLPADKNVFKTALKITAAADMAAGRLNEPRGETKLRDAYIVSYAHLAKVAPDDLAERVNRFYESIVRARDLGDVDARTLTSAIVSPGEGDLEREVETNAEFGRLADEFKAFLAEVEAGRARQADTLRSSLSSLAEVFPRWKACVLLFVGLTAATVFVPAWFAWIVFSVATGLICWRGYRSSKMPAGLTGSFIDAIGLGLIGGLFIGTLLWGGLASPLQRNGLIRLSRDIHISSPEWFLCCLWNGKSPKGDR
jgi:hypothetical protein